jgi:diguanylate cyclase (GGDEF)-like protein
MPALPQVQLQAILGQLDQALYNHEQWTKGLVRALVARLPADVTDLRPDAHHRCRFGQWIESGESEPLRQHPTFVALVQSHEQMHRQAAEMLRRGDEGLPVSAEEFDQFGNSLDRVRLEIQSLRRELSETLQNRDVLTGARNRVSLLSDLREQHALVRRGVQSCGLVMFDLDHFKKVNDQYGHLAGDAVLVSTVSCVQARLRPYDRIYRYGGEEFLITLPGSDLPTAIATTERLRVAVAEQADSAVTATRPRQVTASFGVTLLDGSATVEECIDRADRAMYAAKSGGRNRVECWSAEPAPPEQGAKPA